MKKKIKKTAKKILKKLKGNQTKVLTLNEICNIMGIKCPKEFEKIANKKRKNLVIKIPLIKKDCIFFLNIPQGNNKTAFVKEVIKANPAVVFISKEDYDNIPLSHELPVIVVDNLIEKQGKVLSYILDSYNTKRIAITGSVGKTTTNQLLKAMVGKEYRAYFNKYNRNSWKAVFYNITHEVKKYHTLYVQECGAAAPYSVERAAAMMHPNAYILTNVLPHHLNYYKTIENVFNDKTSFSKYMNKDDVIFANYDDEMINKAKFNHKIVSFGINTKSKVDYRAKNIVQNDEMLELDIEYNKKICHLEVNIVGEHNAYNILGAFAAAKWLGISDEKIAKNVLSFKTTGIRQNIVNIAGATFYLDCYNICGESIKSGINAIENMNIEKGAKKIAILGGENKLGKDYQEITYNLGKEISNNKLDYIICYSLADETQQSIDYYGESKPIYQALKDSGYKNVELITNPEDLTKKLEKLIKPKDIVLVKANAELDITVVLDKLYGTSFTMDHEYKDERVHYIKTKNYELKANDDFKAGNLLKCPVKHNHLTIPDEIEGFKIHKIARKLFKKNTKIKTIDFGKTIVNISYAAFARCTNLTKIHIPSNVKFISESAFSNCSNLNEVIIDEGTIHIDKSAFYKCISLKKVVLPKSLKYIDPRAFNRTGNNFTIYGHKNSLAESFAKEQNIKFESIN